MTRRAGWQDSPFLRFLLSGGVNTALTYLIYLVLLQWVHYQISYATAYVSGILVAYVLNRVFVFRGHDGLRSVLLFPLVYVVQYGAGVAILWLSVEIAGISEAIAPLIVIALTVPLTFALSRYVFLGRARESSGG